MTEVTRRIAPGNRSMPNHQLKHNEPFEKKRWYPELISRIINNIIRNGYPDCCTIFQA